MTASSLEPAGFSRPDRPRRAQHGTTNQVFIDRQRGTVTKVFTPPADDVHWRSQDREVSALRLPGLGPLVPRLLTVDSSRMTTALLEATPLPELIASSDDDSTTRCRLAASTGTALRRIHGVRAGHVTALAWAEGGSQPWWDVFWARLRKTAARVCELDGELRPFVHPALDALERRLPLSCPPRLGLLHGDYGGANLLIRRGDVASPEAVVVDWEWAAIGDVDYDLCRIEWLILVGRDARHWAGPRARAAFYDAYGGDFTDDDASSRKIACYGGLMALGDLVRQLTEHSPADRRIITWLTSISRMHPIG